MSDSYGSVLDDLESYTEELIQKEEEEKRKWVNEEKVATRNAPLIVSCGAGVNTMAVLISLRRKGIMPDFCVFANTGGEKPETYRYIDEIMIPWLKENKFPALEIVKNKSPRAGHKSLEDECLTNETLPSKAFGLSSCSFKWKIEPQDKFINSRPAIKLARRKGHLPIKAIGIDFGESRRAKIKKDAFFHYWYPLVEWEIDREDCLEIIEEEGIPAPPKSACFFCPSSKKEEILWLADNHPDLLERAFALERNALNNTRFPLQAIKGLGRHWSWEDFIRASKEEQESMQKVIVEPCVICDV